MRKKGLLPFALAVLMAVSLPNARQEGPRASEEFTYIPRDINECFVELKVMLSEEQIRRFRGLREEEVFFFDFGLGRRLRDLWELYSPDSPLVRYFSAMGVTRPDDIASIVLTSFHRQLNGRQLRLDEQLAFFSAGPVSAGR